MTYCKGAAGEVLFSIKTSSSSTEKIDKVGLRAKYRALAVA